MFAANWSGALHLGGMDRGAYHFFTATSSAEEQARAFLKSYPGAGELPPVLDLERGINGSAPRVEEALRWIEIIREHLGVMPMIYCSPAFADAHSFGEHEELAECDLWVAHYGVDHPRVPRPWSSWRAWQRGTGRVAGIKGLVDLDLLQAPPQATAAG